MCLYAVQGRIADTAFRLEETAAAWEAQAFWYAYRSKIEHVSDWSVPCSRMRARRSRWTPVTCL